MNVSCSHFESLLSGQQNQERGHHTTAYPPIRLTGTSLPIIKAVLNGAPVRSLLPATVDVDPFHACHFFVASNSQVDHCRNFSFPQCCQVVYIAHSLSMLATPHFDEEGHLRVVNLERIECPGRLFLVYLCSSSNSSLMLD